MTMYLLTNLLKLLKNIFLDNYLFYHCLLYRDSGLCIALLGESVNILLFCLETVNADYINKGVLAWEIQDAIKCATFLRRVYEEVSTTCYYLYNS